MKKQSNVPQIRFQNFEELWKDDKLKNIFKHNFKIVHSYFLILRQLL